MKVSPFAVTWTYDRGYMVAGSDRGAAARAIATRNGGSPLVWSPAFQQQLATSAGLHPSGFVWLNTNGVLQGLAALVPNASIQKLAAERDPILVIIGSDSEFPVAAGIEPWERRGSDCESATRKILNGIDGCRTGKS
jgi:hypothetical protein